MTAAPNWRALALAGHEGDEATARAGLASPDHAARELALGALDRMGALRPADLAAAAADPAPEVRRRLAMLAAHHHDLDLAPLLADADPTVVEAAAWAAGERADAVEHLVPTLVALAGSADDALVREAAIASLGAIGHPDGLAAILAGCRDKPAVRRRAVLALAPFDGPEVDAALAAALQDHDWQVRQSAEDVLPEGLPKI